MFHVDNIHLDQNSKLRRCASLKAKATTLYGYPMALSDPIIRVQGPVTIR